MSKSSSRKDTALRAVLEEYLTDTAQQCDLGNALTHDFLYGFGEYLATRHDRNYSPATCREILYTLRKYLHRLMLQGLLPNIDSLPAVVAELDARYWANLSDEGKRQEFAEFRHDSRVKETVGTMMRFLDSWSVRQKLGYRPKSPDRIERTEALQNRCFAIYLFCVVTYGLEIKDALAIRRDWEGQEVPDSVYVEKYRVRLPLSETAKKLVKIYNRGAECTDHLFFTLDNKKYKGDLDNAAALIGSHIAGFISRRQLPLYRFGTPFVDWLNYSLECGLPYGDAEILWRSRRGQLPVAAALTPLQTAQARLTDSDVNLDETWYLLSLIPMSVKRDRLMKILISSGIFGDKEEAARRIYAPEEKFRDKERGEYAVFSRYIFFRSTPIQAEYVNTLSPYAYVFRDKVRRKFAQIREEEIRHLQVMLRDFPDAVELVDGEKWLEEHNAQIVEGCKAIIRSGNLIGKEATVVRIKGKKSGKPTYFIEYIEGAVKFQTNLEGVELDIVPV